VKNQLWCSAGENLGRRIYQLLNVTRHRASTSTRWHFAYSAMLSKRTKPVHRLQIRPIMHNQRAPTTIPPTYIRVRAVVWECGEGQTNRQTDTQTALTNIHFASATPHAKC